MICGAISLEGCTDLYRLGNGRLTVMRHRDEILGPIVRRYAGAMGPRLLLVHNNACPHVARVCREFLESETIDTTDWPPHSSDLNQKNTSGTLCFQPHQVAPHTVQELSDALVQIWSSSVPQDIICHLIRSPDIVRQACGANTNYSHNVHISRYIQYNISFPIVILSFNFLSSILIFNFICFPQNHHEIPQYEDG